MPFLLAAAVSRHRGAERRGKDLAAVIAVGSRVGDGVDLHRGQRAVLLCTQLDRDFHRMAGDRRGKLFGAREFPLHRAAGLQRRQHAQVLGQQLLLAAEPAADVFGKDVELVRIHPEQVGELDLDEVRGLGAGADVDAAVGGAPGDRAVGFHVRMLDLRQRERAFVDGVRLGKSPGHITGLGFDFLEDVVRRVLNPGVDVLAAMKLRGAGKHGLLGVEHGGKHLVVHFHQPAALLRGGLGFGDHGGDPLADEPRDVVEHVGVVGIDVEIVVTGRREGPPRHVLPGENRMDPRQRRAPFPCGWP